MKKLLFYNVDPASLQVYRSIAKTYGVEVFVIGDENLDMKLKSVFGIEEDQIGYHEEFTSSYMLIDGIDQQTLINIIQAFKGANFAFDGIKVMHTPINETWTMREMMEETKREHAVAKRVVILQEMLKACNDVDMSVLNEDVKEEFKKAVVEVYMLLQSGEFEEEETKHAINRMSNVLFKVQNPLK